MGGQCILNGDECSDRINGVDMVAIDLPVVRAVAGIVEDIAKGRMADQNGNYG